MNPQVLSLFGDADDPAVAKLKNARLKPTATEEPPDNILEGLGRLKNIIILSVR